ncbi:hypothetical protein [Actinokineospora sp. NBRC 105648]|uniref:hypothetical protein n=1 Tax=Actinokineospora sp. NBRC 105648 TaxID=3032206 RepID=UPI0024A4B21A|nr:hypothetical protein [Actinokineospora sp. NBRC 105648]GLZ40797.1 hypothetical protein Acsp05_44210 [Actinokineospora sp. NBRC 105648]
MSGWTIVEWGVGSGFALSEPTEGPRPPAQFVRAAESLTAFPVVQPPAGTGDHTRFPVWCLVYTEVEEFGPHWCFSVQGRDGTFARAGSCQFLFAPASVHPYTVWLEGVERVGPNGKLAHARVCEVPFDAPAPARVADLLAAIDENRHHVPVDGAPLEVAALITSLLGRVPAAVARSRIWATYLLKPAVLDDYPVLSGHWPAETAANHGARVRQWLGEATPGRARDESDARAFDWLARAQPDQLVAYHGLPDLRALLDVVIREELGVRPQDVPRLFTADPDRLRTAKGSAAVLEWAQGEPVRAIAYLVPPRLPADLAEVVFAGVLRAHRAAGPGENPAWFPPADAGQFPDWHRHLADFLIRALPDRRDRIALVKDTLLAPGRPLSDVDAVYRSGAWLASIGVSPQDPTVGIFPPSPAAIAAALAAPGGTISAAHRAFLRDSPDPVETLGLVAQRIGYITPPVADQFLDVVGEQARPGLLATVLRHNARYPDVPVERWVIQLGERRPHDEFTVVEGAYPILLDLGLLSDQLLSRAMAVYADQPGDSEARRRLMREAGERFQRATAGGRPVTVPVPRTQQWQEEHSAPADFGPTGPDPGLTGFDTAPQVHSGHLTDRRRPDRHFEHGDFRDGDDRRDHGERRQRVESARPGGEPESNEELPPALRLLLIVGVLAVVAFAVYHLFLARLG